MSLDFARLLRRKMRRLSCENKFRNQEEAELNMEIDQSMYLWVPDANVQSLDDGQTMFDAIVFDSAYGFGGLDARRYDGMVFVLANGKRSSTTAELHLGHRLNKGLFWSINKAGVFSPPCLLTSNEGVRLHYSGPIEWADGIDFPYVENGAHVPVKSEHCIGVFHRTDTGEDYGWVYADNQDLDIGQEVFWSAEFDDQFGRLVLE